MADPDFISQDIIEAAADDATTAISQDVIEAGADSASTFISQGALEAGADDAVTFNSQAVIEAGADDSPHDISQTVIEYAVGDTVPIPPEPPHTGTFVFDEGGGVEWWLVAQISDSGIELRDKLVKAVCVTGKITNADAKVFTYGPVDPIVVSDLEDGINSASGAIPLADTAQVARSQRWQVNCPNAMLHTIRVAGEWDGESPRDRVDEMQYELAQSGVRR